MWCSCLFLMIAFSFPGLVRAGTGLTQHDHRTGHIILWPLSLSPACSLLHIEHQRYYLWVKRWSKLLKLLQIPKTNCRVQLSISTAALLLWIKPIPYCVMSVRALKSLPASILIYQIKTYQCFKLYLSYITIWFKIVFDSKRFLIFYIIFRQKCRWWSGMKVNLLFWHI